MLPVATFYLSDVGRGGVNEKISPINCQDNESTPPSSSVLALKNCHTDTIGRIVKRNGYTVYVAQIIASGHCEGLYQYKKFDGSEYELAVFTTAGSKKVYDISNPSSVSDITGAASITHNSFFDFAQVADILMLTDEARDTPLKWSGSGNVSSLAASAPAGKYCEEFFNYPFIANTSVNPERVYWGPVFDPAGTWVATDFKRLEGACTGMIRQDTNLIMFTRSSIWVAQYTGDSLTPFTFQRLETSVGLISNRTLVNIEGVLYWQAQDAHVYRMGSNLQPERLTEAIPVTIASLNQGALNLACGVNHAELRQYWLCCTKSSSTQNDFTIVIDYLNNSIFFFDGIEAHSIANFSSSSGTTKTYFGDQTGRVYLSNNGSIDYLQGAATAIDFWRYTKPFNLGNGINEKRIRKIACRTNNQGNYTTLVNLFGDFGLNSGETISLNHTGGEKLLGIDWVLGFDALGKQESLYNCADVRPNVRYLQLKFSNDAYSQPVEISDLGIQFQTLERLC